MSVKSWFCDLAWVGRVAADVLIEVDDDRIVRVTESAGPSSASVRLKGFTIPGLVNAHSHAFHRALRGRTHSGVDSFWSWRDEMYRVAERLDPDSCYRLARAVYGEMALAGITTVGEFHYVHHQPDGTQYDDPNEMGRALMSAASEAGIRLTLLDACYLQAGFGKPPEGVQVRFSDGDARAWAERVEGLEASPGSQVGAAIHSVRAVDSDSIRAVAGWADIKGRPLHVHVSEQPAENDAAQAATGRTPTQLLSEAGALGPTTTAVHATHLTPDDVSLLGEAGGFVCLCPTTERELADGIAPAARLTDAGVRLTLGSDSQAVVDLLEEARLVELHERLRDGTRGGHGAPDLLAAATANGAKSLGWEAGNLEAGFLADFVAMQLDSPRTAGIEDPATAVVFSAAASDVTDVVVGGNQVVETGIHLAMGDVSSELFAAMGDLLE